MLFFASKFCRLILLLAALDASVWAQPRATSRTLRARIETLLQSTQQARRAHWGIQVVDLRTGRTLYQRNAGLLFRPASNVKLLTAAAALVRLGPDHRFRTRVLASARPSGGVIHGDLVLEGGGDPSLSGRTFPYAKGDERQNALGAMDALARRISAQGVLRIRGDIVGDDSRYVQEPFPEGWAHDDAAWEYGAPVSALTFNDSAIRLLVEPREPGALAGLTLEPPLERLVIHNRVRTNRDGPTKLELERRPSARELILSGQIAARSKPREIWLAADDSALFAAAALRSSLIGQGVTVDGGVRASHRSQNARAHNAIGIELTQHQSPPLLDVLKVALKVSQNLQSEVLLRELGRVRAGQGSSKAGLAEVDAFLTSIQVPRATFRVVDGSGLSRQNLLSPEALSRLLAAMYDSPHREAWLAMLPEGGVDGTLEDRFPRARGASAIRAKTGTLDGVNALSGYALRRRGAPVAFSILVNGYAGPAAASRKLVDQIALAILNSEP